MLIAAGGCSRSGAPETFAGEARLEISRSQEVLLVLQVTIADTPGEQLRGLMGRKTLSPSEGMAFVFPRPRRDPFWMKGTLIPLDIAYWSPDLSIVDVQTMQPCRDDPCPVYAPSREYIGAVEAAAGNITGAGVAPGDRVEIRAAEGLAPAGRK